MGERRQRKRVIQWKPLRRMGLSRIVLLFKKSLNEDLVWLWQELVVVRFQSVLWNSSEATAGHAKNISGSRSPEEIRFWYLLKADRLRCR
jgi:hypothetical protein